MDDSSLSGVSQFPQALLIFLQHLFPCLHWINFIDLSSCLWMSVFSILLLDSSTEIFILVLIFLVLKFPFCSFSLLCAGIFYFSNCLKNVCDYLLKHIYDSCLKVFVR